MYNNDYLIQQNPIVAEPEGLERIFGAATGVMIALLIVLILVLIAVAVIMIIANCKLFEKSGEKWWKSLIPGYNNWVLTKITGLAWWWFPIMMGLIFLFGNGTHVNSAVATMLFLTNFNYNYNLSKKFGKTNGFAVLLTLLPVIGYPILAFGSAKYNKEAKVDKNGIFSIEK